MFGVEKWRKHKRRRRLRRGLKSARGMGMHTLRTVRDGAIQSLGVGALGYGLTKFRPSVAFSRNASFKKRLTRDHRRKISRSLKNRVPFDQQLKRGESVSKIFRNTAGGFNRLASSRKYLHEASLVARRLGGAETGLSRADRISAVLARRRRIF
jgi:hypothetical protein